MARRLVSALLSLAALVGPARAAGVTSSDVQLEVAPAVIQLAPGEATDVALILRNPASSSLEDLQLRFFTATAATVDNVPLKDVRVGPGEALPLAVRITQSVSGRTTGPSHFQITFSRRTSGDSQSVRGLTMGALDIQDRADDPVEKMAEVRIETAVAELDEQHPEPIFLLVKNTSPVPVTVTRASSYQPDFIQVTFDGPQDGRQLAPGAIEVVKALVKVGNRAHPGTHRLLFEVGLAWVRSGRPGSGTLVAAHTVKVGVFGESDLLKMVGVPSLLFLPGFLMLSTFVLLWTRVAPATTKPDFTIPEFALLSITLSLVAASAYPLITRMFNHPRDYLRGYGLVDIFQVWFGSVFVGLFAWSVVTGGRTLGERLRLHRERARNAQEENERALRTPRETDSPLDILDKLARNKVRFPLPRVTVSGRGGQAFLLLQEEKQVPQVVWLAPPIEVVEAGGDSDDWTTRLEEAAKPDGGGPASLAKAFRDAGRALELRWANGDAVTRPTSVTATEVSRLEGVAPRFFFQIG